RWRKAPPSSCSSATAATSAVTGATVAAASIAATGATGAAAVTSVATVTVAARAVRAGAAVRATPKMQPPMREAPHERPGRRWRRWPSPLLPSPQELPVLRAEGAEDRLQGHAPPAALRVRARQDRAEPHHRRVGQEAA